MFKRIVFVDPSLRSQYSHNYRYAESLKSSFPSTRIEILAAKEFQSDLADMLVKRVFDVDMYDEYAFVHEAKFISGSKELDPRVKFGADLMNTMGLPGDFCAKAVTFLIRTVRGIAGVFKRLFKVNRAEYETTNKLASQIYKQLNSANLDEECLVIFPTALFSLMESLMTVRALNSNKAWKASASFILHFDHLHFASGYAAHSPKLYKKRVIENMPFKSVQVCVTNKPLQEKLKQELNLDSIVINDLAPPTLNVPIEKEAKTPGLKILIPGRYMWDKNFQLVPPMLTALADIECEVTLHSSVLQHIHIDEALLGNVEVYNDVSGSAEWLQFLANFDCLLLPYGTEYECRVSGILTEAKVLGVPTLVSSKASDAKRVIPECVFNSLTDLPGILDKVNEGTIDGANAYLPNIGREYKELLYDTKTFVETKTKPIAVQIKPAWVHCGSTLVFENQLEYLLQNGYFVVELLVKNIVWNRTKDQVAEAYDLLLDNRKDYGGALAHCLRPNPSFLNVVEWVFNLKMLATSGPIGKYNFFMRSVGVPSVLKKLLENDGTELVICNHVYHLGLAERLNPKRTICETHDIQSKQYQLRGILPDEFAYNKSIDEELSILKHSADALVNISAYEHFFFSNKVQKPNVLCKPYRELTDYTSFICESFEQWLSKNVVNEEVKSDLLSTGIPKRASMFFIGDGHHANITSLSWFINEVLPLIPDVQLWLAGTVSSHFSKELGEHPQIHYLGYIESLDNVYDFVDVAILPDQSGAGIPIKTVDVLSFSAAFTATTLALRGVNWKKYGYIPCDSAASFAADIELLLNDKNARESRIVTAKQMAVEFSKASFYKSWDEVLKSVDG